MERGITRRRNKSGVYLRLRRVLLQENHRKVFAETQKMETRLFKRHHESQM
jgi:hypothetical protein